ncbi:MAG: TATA-box-binding protein [Candidatus Thermoplasmatota archaeon]|nr:TATA-box-binding protein [Candidatus Thermoplasmatota archaeon]
MPEVIVENIVASTSFAEKLDLDAIAQALEEAEYEPEQFPGLVYRLEDPKTATLLFRSGKANCTGAKNVDNVRKTIDIIADKLRKLGIEVYENNELKIVIQNIVAISDLGSELNLNEVAIGLGLENVEYEPEQFPGLVYRIDEPKVAMLLFGSGKLVCTGARKTEDVSLAIQKLTDELTSLDLLRR